MAELAYPSREQFLKLLMAHPPELRHGESRGWDGMAVKPHHHDEMYQFDYFTGGTGRYEIDGTVYEIEDGRFFLSCPGQTHAIDPIPSATINSLGIKFALAPLVLRPGQGPRHIGFENAFRIDDEARKPFVRLMRSIVSQAVLGDTESLILAANGLRELLVRLSRLKADGRLLTLGKRKGKEDAVERVWDYLQANLHKQVRLDALSRHAGLSRFHLARVFAAATGKTPHQALTQLRLARSKTLVLETKLPIAEIAHRVGLRKPAYFSALFKKAYGLPPRTMRANTRTLADPANPHGPDR